MLDLIKELMFYASTKFCLHPFADLFHSLFCVFFWLENVFKSLTNNLSKDHLMDVGI